VSDSAATYTARELAELRRCSIDTIYRWVDDGLLQPLPRRPGGSLRFSASDVEWSTEAATMGARFDRERGRWFVDFWYHHPTGERERVRLDSPVNTRKGAISYEQKVRQEIAAGTWRKAEPTTLRAFVKDFVAWAKANTELSTWEHYESICDLHLAPHFGRSQLAAIDTAALESYKAAKLAAGLSRKTINNHLGVLSKMLSLAVEWHKLRAAPRFVPFRLQRIQDQDFRWLTRAEADRLVGAAWGYWGAMITVALHTGLRMGEIQALRWEDVDAKGRKLTVRQSWYGGAFKAPKSGKPRTIPLNAASVEALERHTRRLHCDLVFCTRRGTVIDKPDLERGLGRVCAAAKVERIGWHVMRHTFASWLVQAGVPLTVVRDLLGHSSIRMTERYAHLAPAMHADAVAMLDATKSLGNSKAMTDA